MVSRYCLLLLLILLNVSLQKKLDFLKATDDCKYKSFSPTVENVKFSGRIYQKDVTTWLVQSGSFIEFYLTGSKAEEFVTSCFSLDKIKTIISFFVVKQPRSIPITAWLF